MRISSISRNTKETQISIDLNLDGSGKYEVDTGVPFLDHMLVQVAVHGFFDIKVKATGDIDIDPHHTMEDISLALGKAFSAALDDRSGIVRMGSVFVPMDESLAFVAVDFSGRPFSVIKVDWHAGLVGTVPVSLIEHFFISFSTTAGCNLHANVLYGRDDHHQAEALFKALGRALSAAVTLDPRRMGEIPSSKGIITGELNGA